MKKTNRIIILSYMLLEFFLLNISFLLVLSLRLPDAVYPTLSDNILNPVIILLLVFNFSWAVVTISSANPAYYLNYTFTKRLRYLTKSILLFIGISATIALLFKIDFLNRTVFLTPIFVFSFLNLLVFNFITEIITRRVQRSYGSNVLVLLGADEYRNRGQVSHLFKARSYASVSFLVDDVNEYSNSKESGVLGEIGDLSSVLDTKQVDEIFLTGTSLKRKQIEDVLKVADYRGVRVSLIPESPTNFDTFSTFDLEGIPVFQYRKSPLDYLNNYIVKKIFDIVFASIVIILLSPLFLVLAILISLDGKGSFLYTPLRKGERGKNFKCYKFRTMSENDNPINGKKSTVKDDPRITKIGKFMRKYDIDELPQFFNVLKGNMSVVGPRPHRVNLQKDFRKIVNDYMVRHYVKPGISGWAQVNGWRGPTATDEQKRKRVEHDLWYIENWSFWLDIKIIFQTVFSKKTRKNAF